VAHDSNDSPVPPLGSRGLPPQREPLIRLPTAAIISAALGAGILAAVFAAWLSVRFTAGGTGETGTAAGGTSATGAASVAVAEIIRSSLLGSGVAIAVTLAGIMALMPWKTRPAGTWATLWLAGTVGRLLLTPLVGLAVYSATPVRTDVFLLSLAGSYLACLAAEVAVSARGVARALSAGEAAAHR